VNKERETKTKANKESSLKIGCWNIRRGLVKRELELYELLKTENLDVMILTETDSNMIKSKEDYRIEG
jgi:hypothetical protein